jgi:UDP-N-acetylmuramoyl-tripeptide--D-alanyl-D-alanine ligase
MNLFVLLYIPYLLVVSKKLLTYLYLWQKKEYRIDKMRDYIFSPESKPFLLNRFNIGYIFALTVISAAYLFDSLGKTIRFSLVVAAVIGIVLFFSLLVAEAIIMVYKTLHRSLLVPVFTKKAVVTLIISSIISIGAILFSWEFGLLSLIILHICLILMSPIIVGLSLLVLYPLDLYLKKRIIQSAVAARSTFTNLQVISISGSYGKTTTKEILFELLSKKYSTKKTLFNHNTTLSVAKKLISLPKETEVFIAELGAYKRGDGAQMCEFLQPTMSIITGLNHQHYTLFGSSDEIVEAESESLDYLPKNGLAIINKTQDLSSRINNRGRNIISYSLGEENKIDSFATNIALNFTGTQFRFHHKSTSFAISMPYIGLGNVENAVGAITAALELGVSQKQIQSAMKHLPVIPGNLELIQTNHGFLINDSYNANTNGVINALLTIQNWQGKKIIILDDVLELGEMALDEHKNIAFVIHSIKPDLVVLVGRNYNTVIKETLLNLDFEGEIVLIGDFVPSAIVDECITPRVLEDSLILFEGYQSRPFYHYITNSFDQNSKK